jgi:hypothetical protein
MVVLDAGAGSSCYGECMNFGNIAVGYLTLRPNGLAAPADAEFPPPMTSTVRTTVVSWVGNSREFLCTASLISISLSHALIHNQRKTGSMRRLISPSTSIRSSAPPIF